MYTKLELFKHCQRNGTCRVEYKETVWDHITVPLWSYCLHSPKMCKSSGPDKCNEYISFLMNTKPALVTFIFTAFVGALLHICPTQLQEQMLAQCVSTNHKYVTIAPFIHIIFLK